MGRGIHHGCRFDFDQHVGMDEGGHLHHGGRRPDGPEHFAVGAADGLPVADVGEVYSTQFGLGIIDNSQRMF